MDVIAESTRQKAHLILLAAIRVRDSMFWCRCPQRRRGLRRRIVTMHDEVCVLRQYAADQARLVLAEIEVYHANPATFEADNLDAAVDEMATAVRAVRRAQ